jgi:O-antigen/teichoic acid export membrane protein
MARSLSINAVANLANAIATIFITFFIYRHVIHHLGLGQLGIWSLVLATTSASRLAELGLGIAVTRFVAKDVAEKRFADAVRVVDSALVALTCFVSVAVFALYAVVDGAVRQFVEAVNADVASSLLPWAAASLVFSTVGGVSQNALDGLQRADVRAVLMVSGSLLMGGAVYLLTPGYGIVGLGIAQLVQGVFLAVVGRWVLCKHMPNLAFLPVHSETSTIKRILPYGLNTQLSVVLQFAFDLITKLLLARFGGSASVGAFEVASQFVVKTRSLLAAAAVALIPRAAASSATRGVSDVGLYQRSFRVVFIITALSLFFLITGAGIYSALVTGKTDSVVVLYIFILAITWAVNNLAIPAYNINLGEGSPGTNTIGNLIAVASSICTGVASGWWLGPVGIVMTSGLSLAFGSLYVIHSYHVRAGLSLSKIMQREDVGLSVVITLLLGLYTVLVYGFGVIGHGPDILLITVLVLMLFFFLRRHGLAVELMVMTKGLLWRRT